MAQDISYDAEAFKQFEQDGWHEVSGTYHDTFGALTRQAVEPVLDAVGSAEGQRLLDVACGTGAITGAAAGRGARATGVDLVEKMVQEARRLHPGAEFKLGDAEDLPFAEASFDAVVCNFGILHFPHPEKAIQEAHRTLAPEGTYALTSWRPPERSPYMGMVYSALGAHADMSVVPAGPPLFRFGDPEECVRAFAQVGFSDVNVTDLPIMAIFSSVLY